jgi:hypothetical protein
MVVLFQLPEVVHRRFVMDVGSFRAARHYLEGQSQQCKHRMGFRLRGAAPTVVRRIQGLSSTFTLLLPVL